MLAIDSHLNVSMYSMDARTAPINVQHKKKNNKSR